ncbi:hypothetical protein JTB14_036153 [Gonioctena quinquepunctata]|nr:hypothetical protein JTB14_036153 [Gonioctena quinquepunctata]
MCLPLVRVEKLSRRRINNVVTPYKTVKGRQAGDPEILEIRARHCQIAELGPANNGESLILREFLEENDILFHLTSENEKRIFVAEPIREDMAVYSKSTARTHQGCQRARTSRRTDDHDDLEHSDLGLSADAPTVQNSDTDDALPPPAKEVQIVPQEDRYAPIADQSITRPLSRETGIARPLSRETGNFRPLSRETGIDTTLPENQIDLSLQSERAVRPEVELPAKPRERRQRLPHVGI